MDGTFKTVPNMFKQLYIIRVQLHGVYLTCAYILMQRSTQNDYYSVFDAIKNKLDELNFVIRLNKVMLDFEIAPRRAIVDVFGHHIETKGCFFHLTQSTWRKVRN